MGKFVTPFGRANHESKHKRRLRFNLVIKKIFCVVALLIIGGCANNKNPDVLTSRGQTVDGSGNVQSGIGVLESELPIEERAFKMAVAGDFSLMESLVVYFDYDSATIKPENRDVLATHARFLENYPQVKVSIAGHTDERGSPEYNMALGQRRASTVAQFLRTLNVSRSQFADIHSYGANRKVALGETEEEHSKNRRVEITYSK